jgi:hypothetical protein
MTTEQSDLNFVLQMAVNAIIFMDQFEKIGCSRSVGNLKIFKGVLHYVGGKFVSKILNVDL